MASNNVAAPERISLSVSGDNEREWKSFKQRFELYLLAAEKSKKSEETKVALLLTIGGSELLQIYNSFEFPAPDDSSNPAKVLESVVEKFDAYFAPRKNELASRYKFRKCVQLADEHVDAYITRLRILIKDCNYEEQRDKELRDQIVFGCADDKLRQKFFETDDLTLQKTVDLCVAYQASRWQMDVFKDEKPNSEAIAKVKQRSRREVSEKFKPNSSSKSNLRLDSYDDDGSSSSTGTKPRLRMCKFCGEQHEWKKEKCPAYGKLCNRCNRPNHFSSKCKRKKINYVNSEVASNHESFSDNSDVEYVLKVSSKNDKLIKTDIEVEGRIVKFQVDCGASVNVIPFHYIPDVNLTPCDTTLEVWTSSTVKPLGKCRLIIRNCKNRKKYNIEFIVVEGKYTPLLGKKSSEQMGLITVNYENICVTTDILSRYDDVFNDEIGTFEDPVHLTVDANAEAVAIPSCKVPINLKKKGTCQIV